MQHSARGMQHSAVNPQHAARTAQGRLRGARARMRRCKRPTHARGTREGSLPALAQERTKRSPGSVRRSMPGSR
eukprot:6177973-Pleurochrysis_carterae.AAC.1